MPKFQMTVNESDNTIQGSGQDHPGTVSPSLMLSAFVPNLTDFCAQFAIAGVLVGDEVRFIKQYYNSNGNAAWKYVGKRLEPKGNVYQFSGGWGDGPKQYGQWVLSGVAPASTPKPTHSVEGQWYV